MTSVLESGDHDWVGNHSADTKVNCYKGILREASHHKVDVFDVVTESPTTSHFYKPNLVIV